MHRFHTNFALVKVELQGSEKLEGTMSFAFDRCEVTTSFLPKRGSVAYFYDYFLKTTSYSIDWEKLLKDQSNFPLVIVLLILVSFFLDYVLLLNREI